MADATISFQAVATDKEDGDLSAAVRWRSSIDGTIWAETRLSAGTHEITAYVDDSSGARASDSIMVAIEGPNTAPSLSILSPQEGSVVSEGSSLTLTAEAFDQEQGDLSGVVQWSSSLDGSISSPALLSVGDHLITATVVDSAGLTEQATVSVSVAAVANTAPTLTITAPVTGSTFTTGATISFQATATDREDGDLSEAVRWRSSIDGTIWASAQLSAGTHEITAIVDDSSGARARDSITVTVAGQNTAPSVSILSPQEGTVVSEGSALTLTAEAYDQEEGNLSGAVQWSSSLDGSISSPALLSLGDHLITATVVDSAGLTEQATVSVSVVASNNTAPVVSIISPANNSGFGEGIALTLQADASDAEEGNLSGLVSWRSSLDGAIASPATLSVGTHTLTATVTDSQGATHTDSVAVTITTVNTAPVVSILSPASGTTVDEGTSLLFTAEAMDEQEGDLSQSVSWESSLDGPIADLATLSVGEHVIYATVVDSQGMTGSDAISVSVAAVDVLGQSLTISWVAPTSRSDGDPLYPEQLMGYEIRLTNTGTGSSQTINLDDGLATTYTTAPLVPGTYELTLRAYDAEGMYSEPTAPVTATITGL
ncbi:MAG: hypothetical protein R3208_06195 [Ketobacteraceae bacterium]|nr:hypothetical protein [Ketobacteraceae bacterium]